MKDQFPEHYSDERLEQDLAWLFKNKAFKSPHEWVESCVPKPDLLSDWSNTHFVFDASALLNIYVMSDSLANRYFEILEKVQNRCFIPYHAAEEYHYGIASSLKDAMGPLAELEDFKQQICSLIETKSSKSKYQNKSWHWFFDDSTYGDVIAAVDKLISSANTARNDLLKTYPLLKEHIASLFDGKVGAKPSEEETQIADLEGERRLQRGIPPSCEKDAEKKKNRYGDVRIWLQLIEFAKQDNKDRLIFICDDEDKENWVVNVGENNTGPRPELSLELKRLANCEFWILSTDAFIRLGQEALALESKPDVEEDLELITAKKKEFLKTKEQRKKEKQNGYDSLPQWLTAHDYDAAFRKQLEENKQQSEAIANWAGEMTRLNSGVNFNSSLNPASVGIVKPPMEADLYWKTLLKGNSEVISLVVKKQKEEAEEIEDS